MAFTALSFVVPFFSYDVLCNLSYDVTRWTWYCNKNKKNAYLWLKLGGLTQSTKLNITVV